MPNWMRSAAALAMIACAMLWTAPASAERAGQSGDYSTPPTGAQVDSLVWYVEQLERDLAVCRIRGDGLADSLRVELRWRDWKIEAAADNAPSWYETNDAGLLAGILVMALAVWAAGRLD